MRKPNFYGIIICLLALSGSGWAQINVALPDTSAELGQEIAIPLRVSSLTGQGVLAYQTRVLFDETLLEIQSVTAANSLTESWGNPTVNLQTPGQASIAGFGTSAIGGAGNLVFLNFRVIGQPGETGALQLQNFLFNADHPQSVVRNGQFQVALIPIDVTITTDWGGGEVIVDGENHPAPFSTTWYKHQSHTISVVAEIATQPQVRYLFVSWSDGGSREHTITPESDSVFTAQMELQYFLTLKSAYGNPQGQGWYASGSSVNIQVDSIDEYDAQKRAIFQSWQGTGNGSYSGTNSQPTVILNEPVEQTANWNQQFYLQLNSDHGTPTGADWYDNGATATFSVDSVVLVPNAEKHLFTAWQGAGENAYSGTSRTTSVLMTGPVTQEASWENYYYLKTAVDPPNSGTVNPPPPGAWYLDGARVEVLATPHSGFGFASWLGDLEGAANPQTIRMSRAKSVTAQFGQEIAVVIDTEPTGRRVKVDGIEFTAPKNFNWIEGSPHELDVLSPQEISANERFVFDSWSDNQPQKHTITVQSTTNYLARFRQEYFLTTQVIPAGSGTISPVEPGDWYRAGNTATVLASPSTGNVFYQWSGAASGTTNPVAINMNQGKSVIANFAAVLAITTSSLPNGVLNGYYSQSIEITGGVAPLTWSLESGHLPVGLELDAATGDISGTPAEHGQFNITVRVTDRVNPPQTASQSYSFQIDEYVNLLSDNFNDGNYNGWVIVDDGANLRPSKWFVENGVLAQTSEIWGGVYDAANPNKPGTHAYWTGPEWQDYEFTTKLRSTDNHAIGVMFRYRDKDNYYQFTMDSKDGYRRLLKKVSGQYQTLQNQNFSYIKGAWYDLKVVVKEQNIKIYFNGTLIFDVNDNALASGGVALYSWKNLGNYFDDVLVKQLQSPPLIVATSSLPQGTAGVAYSASLVASGGVAPYSWSIISSSLPDGLYLNATTGEISGTPNTVGTANFTVEVIDSDTPAASATRNLSLTINPPAELQITKESLKNGQAYSAYEDNLTATGGVTPYAWEIAAGTLPAGLSLTASTGAIRGTPTTQGTFTFTARVRDSGNPPTTATKELSIFIAGLAELVITTHSVPQGTVAENYSATLAATGGRTPYSWKLASGNLPPGLSLSAASGVISGTPSTAGTFNFKIRVEDSAAPANADEQDLSMTVLNVPPVNILTTSLPDGAKDQAYSAQLTAEKGTTPYSWRISNGSLPSGLNLNSSSGLISGTPTRGGTFSFEVEVTDNSSPKTLDKAGLAIRIDETTILLSDDFNDFNYNGWTIVDEGRSRGPSNWQVNNGMLQQLSNIYGDPQDPTSPDKPGTFAYWFGDWSNYEFTVNLRSDDNDGIGVMFRYRNQSNYYRLEMNQEDGYRRLMKKVDGKNLTVVEDKFAYAKNVWYAYRIVVEANKIQVYMTGGAVTNQLVFEVTDNAHAAGGVALYSWNNDKSYFDNVVVTGISSGPAPLAITTTSLPNGQVNQNYSTTVAASGGTPPLTWSVVSGNLPAGLTLNASTGEIRGIPTQEGNFSVSAQVSDAGNPVQTDTQNFNFTIQGIPALSISTTSLPNGMVGQSYSAKLEATGGEPPYTWRISSGSLPAGLSLNAVTGEITGIPSTVETATFTAEVKDSGNRTNSKLLTMTTSAVPPVNILTTSLPDGTQNQAYSAQLTAEKGTAPYSWRISSGNLPSGLNLNSSSGLISGTPTRGGTFSFEVEVTDNSAPKTSDKANLSIQIDETTILLSDNFNDGNYNGWVIVDDGTNLRPSKWAVENGALVQTSEIWGGVYAAADPNKPGTHAYWAGPNWQDYEFSVKLRSTDNHAIGVLFRYRDKDNYYQFTMDSKDNYRRLVKKVNGQNQILQNQNFAYSKGTWYDLNVVVKEQSLKIYFNGTLIFDVTDSALASGGVALYCWKNLANYFDDVLVTGISSGPAQLTITTTSLPDGQVNANYRETLAASGGTAPFTWEISSGNLPAGLNLTGSTGIISGTPTTAGTSNFKVKVTDSGAPVQTATRDLSIIVNTLPQLTITTTSLRSKMLGETYADTLEAKNGQPPYSWSIVSGNLPNGLALNASNGMISGTPALAGIFNFTAKVVDSAQPSQEDTQALSIEIVPRPSLEITTTSLNNASLDTPYADTLKAVGGLKPYTWTLASGSLPPGLALNSAGGQITGTPTESGNFEFRAKVVDSANPSDTEEKACSILVNSLQNYLTEDFGDGNFDGWTIVDQGTSRGPSNWTVYWNALEQTTDIYDGDRNAAKAEQFGTYAYWYDLSWTNYDATLELRSDDDDALGVMFRYQNADNYYRFSMDKERSYRRLVRRYQGQSIILAEDKIAYVSSRWHQVKIRVIGSSITVFYNGAAIFQVTDSAISSGGIALYSWYNQPSKFDNISVTTPVLGKRQIDPVDQVAQLQVPTAFELYQNYPNPFNPETTINFDLPEAGEINLTIYNLLGQPVKTVVQENFNTGHHQLRWDATDAAGNLLASGIYIYRIHFKPNQGNQQPKFITRKMLLMK